MRHEDQDILDTIGRIRPARFVRLVTGREKLIDGAPSRANDDELGMLLALHRITKDKPAI